MYEYISYPILTLYNEHFEQNFKGFTFRGFWDPDPHSRRGGVCPPPPRNFWEIKGKKRENGKNCNIVTYFSSLGNFITKGGRLKPDFWTRSPNHFLPGFRTNWRFLRALSRSRPDPFIPRRAQRGSNPAAGVESYHRFHTRVLWTMIIIKPLNEVWWNFDTLRIFIDSTSFVPFYNHGSKDAGMKPVVWSYTTPDSLLVSPPSPCTYADNTGPKLLVNRFVRVLDSMGSPPQQLCYLS